MENVLELSADVRPTTLASNAKPLTERAPLLGCGKEGGGGGKVETYDIKIIPPAAQKNSWIPSADIPVNRPFQKLVIPLTPIMPSSLEFDGEEVRARIGNENWNKMISDAQFIGQENAQIQTCFNFLNGAFVYICFPCFWYCIYKYTQDKTTEIFAKWKDVFDKKKIPFELYYKPGSLQEAFFACNFEYAHRTHCFLIDVEHIVIDPQPRKAQKQKPPVKTPENECSMLCFETSNAYESS
jgi:hypothetical protein